MTHFTRRRMLTTVAIAAAGLTTTVSTSQAIASEPSPHESEPVPLTANPSGQFVDKVVLITGATSGIGKVTAQAFAAEGAQIAFCGRREDLGA